MLSIGGDSPYVPILDEAVAVWFADFLWYSFGPHHPELDGIFPRPFRNNSVDGFDFDIEHGGGYGRLPFVSKHDALLTRSQDTPLW